MSYNNPNKRDYFEQWTDACFETFGRGEVGQANSSVILGAVYVETAGTFNPYQRQIIDYVDGKPVYGGEEHGQNGFQMEGEKRKQYKSYIKNNNLPDNAYSQVKYVWKCIHDKNFEGYKSAGSGNMDKLRKAFSNNDLSIKEKTEMFTNRFLKPQFTQSTYTKPDKQARYNKRYEASESFNQQFKEEPTYGLHWGYSKTKHNRNVFWSTHDFSIDRIEEVMNKEEEKWNIDILNPKVRPVVAVTNQDNTVTHRTRRFIEDE